MTDVAEQDSENKPDPRFYRDRIAEELSLAAFYADHAQGYAEIGDDSGLAYGLQRLIDHVRGAARQHKLLGERKATNDRWWAKYEAGGRMPAEQVPA